MNGEYLSSPTVHRPQSTATNLSPPSPTQFSSRHHPPFLGPIPAAGPPVGTGTAGLFDLSTIRFRSISSYTRAPHTRQPTFRPQTHTPNLPSKKKRLSKTHHLPNPPQRPLLPLPLPPLPLAPPQHAILNAIRRLNNHGVENDNTLLAPAGRERAAEGVEKILGLAADAAAALGVERLEAGDGVGGAGGEGARVEGRDWGVRGGEVCCRRRRGGGAVGGGGGAGAGGAGGGGGEGEEGEGGYFGDGEDVVGSWVGWGCAGGGGGGRGGGWCGWRGGVDGDEVGDGAGGEEGAFEGVVVWEGGSDADAGWFGGGVSWMDTFHESRWRLHSTFRPGGRWAYTDCLGYVAAVQSASRREG